jgi:hypothetical protein
MDGYTAAYLLSQDRQQIRRVQDATHHTEEYGIAMEHGLFGSDDWWQAIDRGDLPIHTVSGKICALLMESMNDWPTFKILTDDGFVTESITRESLPLNNTLYELGRRIIWKYVELRHVELHGESIYVVPSAYVTFTSAAALWIPVNIVGE